MDMAVEILTLLKEYYTAPLAGLVIFTAFFIALNGFKRLNIERDSIKSGAQNLLLILWNSLIYGLLFGGGASLSNYLFQSGGLPHLSENLWAGLPWIALFILSLLILDLVNYVTHRLMHTPLLWPAHVLHHSDTHMNWTTVYRVHILQMLFMQVCFILLAGWLFLPPEIIAAASVARVWHSKLCHSQLGWTFGPFRKVLCSPNYHRWHHSIDPKAHDKNLADMFPVWDILFGTHYDPGKCETALGVDDADTGFVEGQLYPFKTMVRAFRPRLNRPKSSVNQT